MNPLGSSPLQARYNFPYFFAFLVALLIFAVIFLIWILVQKRIKYTKSKEHLEKEISRKTKKRDITKIAKECELTKDDIKYLLKLTNKTNSSNLFYIIKDLRKLRDFSRECYAFLKSTNANDFDINHLYKVIFKFEKAIAKKRKIISTKQIKTSSVVFYITKEGDSLPFYCVENTTEYFSVEIPDFFLQKKDKPNTLDKIYFTYKPQNGLSYCFSTRILRYTKLENKNLMVLAHSDNIFAELQRNNKRKPIDYPCNFTSIKKEEIDKKSEITFIFSDNYHQGKLINISGGGCCFKTSLPIKENQKLGITIPLLDLTSPIVGLIKKTRKMPDGTFALHIQFIKFSTKEQNKILAFIYGFDL